MLRGAAWCSCSYQVLVVHWTEWQLLGHPLDACIAVYVHLILLQVTPLAPALLHDSGDQKRYCEEEVRSKKKTRRRSARA